MSALTTAFISLRSGAQTQLSSSITQDFDQNVGPLLGLTSQSFLSVYDLFPEYDPRKVTEGVLCHGKLFSIFIWSRVCTLVSRVCVYMSPSYNTVFASRETLISIFQIGQNAGRLPGAQQSVNTCACQLPSSIRPGADNPPPFSPHLSKRVIDWNWDSIPGNGDYTNAPDLHFMINGILNGDLQFMYTRLIRYNPAGDGIVEMAWRIPAGQQFNTYRYVHEDQFFVLHAHTNHILVTQEGGPRYAGVYQMGSFHGQQWDNENNRVNGNPTNIHSGNNDNDNYQDNLTGRTPVMACIETPRRQYFYPGAPNSEPPDTDCDPIVTQLGDHLRTNGILDGRTLNMVGGSTLEPDFDGFIEDLAWDFLFRGESPSFDANHNPYHFPG